MRKVQVFKWVQELDGGVLKNKQVSDYIGSFHQFAQEADGEGQSNPVAIVEREDGSIETVYVGMIKFLTRGW